MNRTGIEYLTHTWNPIAMRCTPSGEDCAHCWHLTMADRLAANPMLSDEIRAAHAGECPPVLVEHRIEEPLARKKPALIGVQYMGDLFHDAVPFAYLDRIFETIVNAPQHTFLVLTKKTDRMLEYMNALQDRLRSGKHMLGAVGCPSVIPNLWLGVTIGHPKYARRARALQQVDIASVRFISFEPLLASFDGYYNVLEDMDWVIVGGESGSGARPMHPNWEIGLRWACHERGIPYYFKQWGAWAPGEHHPVSETAEAGFFYQGKWLLGLGYSRQGEQLMVRVGKKRAGHLIGGKAHRAFPEVYYYHYCPECGRKIIWDFATECPKCHYDFTKTSVVEVRRVSTEHP